MSRRYLLSRAVEDPIDATFQLSEEMGSKSKKLKSAVLSGIILTVVIIILLAPSIFILFYTIADLIIGRIAYSAGIGIVIGIHGMLQIILLSAVVTTLIFSVQVHRFYKYLFQRHNTVSEFKSAEIESKSEVKKLTGEGGKHRSNPILAMLDLVEESSHQLYNIISLLKWCGYLLSLAFVILLLIVVLNLSLNIGLLTFISNWTTFLFIIPVILLIPTIISITDSWKFLTYYETRHNIIDNVKFERLEGVPSGKNPLERLTTYLEDNDPYIHRAVKSKYGEFQFKKELTGKSGENYKFDAYFAGMNDKILPGGIGLPEGKFAAFIKIYKKPITKESLKRLREAVLDICGKDECIPMRIIALQWEIGELDDEVYDYVLGNPIVIKNTMSHLQIIAEDEGTYSFIPIISYERGVR